MNVKGRAGSSGLHKGPSSLGFWSIRVRIDSLDLRKSLRAVTRSSASTPGRSSLGRGAAQFDKGYTAATRQTFGTVMACSSISCTKQRKAA